MSKSTQILAALGVVAALGVAALPLSSYAATDRDGLTVNDGEGTADATNIYDGTKDGSVADTIKVKTTIEDTLALTIAGADDTDGETGDNHLVLLGTDGKIVNGQNAEGTATVTVATNHVNGYKVSINGEATGFNGTTNASEKFAQVTADNTFPTTGVSVFGYKAETTAANLTVSNAKTWNPVPVDSTEFAASTKATELNGDALTLTFQAHASESQAADTYDEVITITAATNA